MSVNCSRGTNIGLRPNVLIVSSDPTFASVLERQLGADFDVHAAATDDAAFVFLDSRSCACVVIDLCAQPASTLRLNALTIPTVALVPAEAETLVPENAIACVNDEQHLKRLVAAVREVAH
jgi:ActR/RegA family two-component response regulator